MSAKSYFLRTHNYFWLLYFILFLFSPFDYKVSIYTVSILILFIIVNLAFSFGYHVRLDASKPPVKLDNSKVPRIKKKSEFNFLVFFSLLCFFFTILKQVSLQSQFGFGISITDLTELRMELDSDEYVKGNNIFGVLSSLFSGFPLLTIPYLLFYRKSLTKTESWILGAIAVFFLIATFASGGRNGAVIVILIYIFSFQAFRLSTGLIK